MESVVWVHREFFDTHSDRTTWVEMAGALRRHGYAVHMVCSYEEQPVGLDNFESVTWLAPAGPGAFRRTRFAWGAWWTLMRLVPGVRPALVVLDEWTVLCGFPLDLLSRVGALRTRFIVDMRTFVFGMVANETTPRDRVLRLQTRGALLYNRAFQQGLTVIVPALAQAARALGARRHIGVWGSGVASVQRGVRGATATAGTPDPPAASPGPGPRDGIERWRAGAFRLVYHGGIGRNRGLRLAVRALGEVRARGEEDVTFLLLGPGSQVEALRAEAESLGVSAQCCFHPPVPHDQVAGIIAGADLAVMVYPDLRYWDFNHPIKLMEYLGVGVPVLCSDIPMFRAVDPTGDVLVYTSADSPGQVADSIQACLRGERDLSGRASRGYAVAEDNTWDRQAERLLEYAALPVLAQTAGAD